MIESMKLFIYLILGFFVSIAWTTRSRRNRNGAHLPWFYDADNYWDFDTIINNTVQDLRGGRHSKIIGNYNLFPGPKDNALELLETSTRSTSHVILGDFSDTCLPNPRKCTSGFTIAFWVNLKKVFNDGVLLQLGLSRKSRGITVNTYYKEGKIFLVFHGNTPSRIYSIRAELSSHIWHHVSLVWNATAKQRMSLFVNCSNGDNFKSGMKKFRSQKKEHKMMILGANHAGKKATPIAVDDFAIWLKTLKQERLCQIINEERVHGNYSSWSKFSPCSLTCGFGRKSRKRVCDDPIPDHGGRDCSVIGPSSETVECNIEPCPISGGYTPWSNFSQCSALCGGGSSYRTRNCTNPKPQYSGKNCSHFGPSLETVECNIEPCPIAGGYTPWSNFSQCLVSCGGGSSYRTRNCTNPKPQYGGENCSHLGSSSETVECNIEPCPIAGGYTPWSNFSQCLVSCGGGSSYRTRNCTNPKPQYGGENCSHFGPSSETVECNIEPCPIAGGYTPWSNFSQCPVSCGGGSSYITRNCTNPKPQYGGENCSHFGPSSETVECNIKPCPISGGYTSWSNFSQCTVSCGGGNSYRTRNCTNPKTQYGGENCSHFGPSSETVECNIKPCPISGGYTSWSNFSQCTVSCGGGNSYRTRNCTNPKTQYGGENCSHFGPSSETVECNIEPCPIAGGYTPWSNFSQCPVSCGGGSSYRTRNCTNPKPQYGGENCSNFGPSSETVECNIEPCPIAGGYTPWSNFSQCPVSCGGGSSYRTRNCTNPKAQYGGENCSNFGPSSETVECNIEPCPIAGGYTPWSNFSQCPVSCGGGSSYRTRNCTNPKPQYGGENCSNFGPSLETVECNIEPCPIAGGYTPWSNFSPCSVSCGGGSSYRTRNCTNPKTQYGGENCSHLGPSLETVECNIEPCPIAGGYTPWSNFSQCPVSCGGGSSYRTRNCTNPKPQYGGENCSNFGPSSETVECNIEPCPIAGGYTPWSNFSQCPVSCGGGSSYRTRNCTNPKAQYGGENCSRLGPPSETVECNIEPCPISGGYTPWLKFSECSASCGGGSRYRTRNCTNPKPKFGGEGCSKLGPSMKIQVCNLNSCPVNGNYSAWSAFSSCSTSCGHGYKTRNRSCMNPLPTFGGRNCSNMGSDYEVEPCYLGKCPVHGGYSFWSEFSLCSQTCGNASKTRTRNCTQPKPRNGGRDCEILGPSWDTVPCETTPCPIHGNYSDWSDFTPCEKTCGNSSKFRRRFCTNPEPRFGGENCSVLGLDIEEVPCYQAPCPIHGNFSEWSEFSKCSSTCGSSVRKRYRNCSHPTPMHGGNNCSSLGPIIQVETCDVSRCPVDGNYSEWSRFSQCSETCDNGSQFRFRLCTNPVPSFGGENCSAVGPSKETRVCHTRPCPIHGNFTEWSEFSGCSKTCGSGVQIRHRYCNNPEPRYGGDNCSKLGPMDDVLSCHVRFCPINGGYSGWSSFGPCSKSCDNGTQVRRRSCTNPKPRFGGRGCSMLGPSVDRKMCETQPCPDIDFFVKFKLNSLNWTDELLDNSSIIRQNLNDELKTTILGLHTGRMIKDIKIMEYRFCASFLKICEGQNRPGSVVAAMEIIYYSREFPGAMILYDAFYNEQRIGPYDVIPLLFTSTDVSTNAVQNLTAFNHSSTSLALHWSPLSSQPGQSRILGYTIVYEELLWPGNVRTNKSIVVNFLNTTRGKLRELKKYSWYSIRIAGMNRRGVGVPSDPLVVLTDEDVPNASPNLKPVCHTTSSTSLNISWTAIARADINGILRGYTVFFKPYSASDEVIHNVTVASDELFVHLTDLRKYTEYELRVAGVTSKGTGGKSAKTLLHTAQDVSTAAPVFHSCGNKSSTSIELQWHKVLSNHQNGVILGYHIYYKQYLGNGSWNNISTQESETRLTVSELKMFTKYLFRISAFTAKGEGVVSDSIVVSTDEDVPCSAPTKTVAGSTNSTSIWLKWHRLPVSCLHGILRGYTVFYKRKSEPKVYQETTVSPTRSEVVLDSLQKFTVYFIRVAGFTSKGRGPLSEVITVKTDEDVPSAWPESIHAINTSSTSIYITWNPIPQTRAHGKLLGYQFFLRKANESEWEDPSNVSDVSDLTLLQLWKYTKYVFRISGFTSVGIGVVSPEVSVWTAEDVPSRAPEQFKTTNKSSPTSIPLTWKPINDPFYIHGLLLGYKIEYQMTHLAGKPLNKPGEKGVYTVPSDSLSSVLTGLEIYAVYRVKIRAFTVKGDGISTEISAETCRCASAYRTNWWINSPYIYKNDSKISGIFPAILPRMVSTCCGFCHEHSPTITRFETSIWDTSQYLKSGVSEFRDHVGDSAELHFPMYGQVHQVKYYKRYEYIALVESPGVVFLVLDDDVHLPSMMLLETVTDSLPVVVLMILMMSATGIVIWCVESFTNPDHFPPSFLSGVIQGTWWAMVSMTTIGYGDRFPRSVAGRIIGILWVLTGAIIMSLYTSIVTSNITAEVVQSELKLYGTTVAVIQNSSEYQLAVRKNAHADLEHAYNNLYDIYNALNQGYVKGALVDAYALGSRRDLFDNIGVRISKIYDYSSAYGVVLAGEAMKLQSCFREYVSENRKDIFQIIEENVHMIKKSDVSTSVKRATSLIDPTFIVYKQCLFITVVLFCLALISGILFECFKKPLRRALCRSRFMTEISRQELLNTQASFRYEMQESLLELTKKLKQLKSKHWREWERWIKLKKALRRDRFSSEISRRSTSAARYDEPADLSPVLPLRKLIVRENDGGNNYHSLPRSQQEETVV